MGAQEEWTEPTERADPEYQQQHRQSQHQPPRVKIEHSEIGSFLARRRGPGSNQPAQVRNQDRSDDDNRQKPGVDVTHECPHTATVPASASPGPSPQLGPVGEGGHPRPGRDCQFT